MFADAVESSKFIMEKKIRAFSEKHTALTCNGCSEPIIITDRIRAGDEQIYYNADEYPIQKLDAGKRDNSIGTV